MSYLHIFSVDFARLILEQYYSNSLDCLLDHETLAEQHILELGSVRVSFFILLSSSKLNTLLAPVQVYLASPCPLW